MHIISSHHAFKDYCKKTYPDSKVDPHTCALIHSFAQDHENYDNFSFPAKTADEKKFNAEFVYWGMTEELNP